MGALNLTNHLKGDISEETFKHYCMNNLYWYNSMEYVYRNLTPSFELEFKLGFRRKIFKIPELIAQILMKHSRPFECDNRTLAFSPDFLTVCTSDTRIGARVRTKRYWSFVEVKSAKSSLSSRQIKLMNNIKKMIEEYKKEHKLDYKVGIYVFRINMKIERPIKVSYGEWG